MKTNALRNAIVFGVLALFGFNSNANAQYYYFPNNATIKYPINYSSIVGYANDSDYFANPRRNPTSPTVSLVSGGSIYELSAYNSSTFNVNGGSIDDALYAYNSSIINITGGSIPYLSAYNSSTVNISGGNISSYLNAYNTSTVNITGGSISSYLNAYNTSTVNISGGSINLDAEGHSKVNISGGNIGYEPYADGNSTVNLIGTNLSSVLIDTNHAGVYSEYALYGTLPDGSSVNCKFVFVQNGTGAKLSFNDAPPDNSMLLTLANMSKDVYDLVPGDYYQGNDHYRPIGTNSDFIPSQASDKGFKAEVYVNDSASQVVIAFRGTDVSDTLTALKNLVADATFINNIPSINLETSVAYAAALVQAVKQKPEYANANITLTGHSLGGAIAQLVGKASRFITVTFNAPGAAGLYDQLQAQLAPAKNLGMCDAIVNYRLKSEQISLIGTQIGSTVTIASPVGKTFSGTSIGGAFEAVASLGTIYMLHLMQLMVDQIRISPQPVDATGEQNVLPALQSAATATLISGDPEAIQIYAFGFFVADATLYLLDPTSGSDYVLTAKSGSPHFVSLALPALSGVAAYHVRYRVGTTWSNFQMLQPGVRYTLAQVGNAIEYQPLDAYGQSTVLPDGFYFGASFASTGSFSGTLTVSNTQATVTGQITLDGINDQSKIVYPVGDITFEFRTPGTSPYGMPATPVLFTKTGTLTTDATNLGLGDYTLTGVTPGTYDIAIKSRNSLRTVVKNVTVTGSAGTVPMAVLPAGDANNDNTVDIADFGVLINAYGGDASLPTSNYDPAADFNYDGVVDISDFGILVNEYGNVGDL